MVNKLPALVISFFVGPVMIADRFAKLPLDIVELNPYHDNGATASLAAKIISTMIAINVAQQ